VPVATGISIWVEDLHGLERVAPEARQVVSEAAPLRRNIQVRTWKETRPDDFAMLEMQDRVMMIILLVLFALDGAFIMAILWVLVSDKTRDIGTVRALGAGRFGVMTTFVLQGLAIGVLGTVLGMAGGLALAEHVNGVTGALDQALGYCGVAPLFKSISANLFGMNRLQVFYDPVHMVSIVATIIAVSVLASLAPAWRAARLDPVEALRHD
jgi:lipoprotein-releasing system permease protein